MAMPPNPPKRFSSPFASMIGQHVAVRVPDFDAAKRWYVEKLDFRVVQEWPFGDLHLAYLAPPTDDGFFLELIGDGSLLAQREYTDLDDSLRPAGYHHFCVTVENVDDTIAELKRRGVRMVGESFELDLISRRLAFFSDPWGNLIELAQVLHRKAS